MSKKFFKIFFASALLSLSGFPLGASAGISLDSLVTDYVKRPVVSVSDTLTDAFIDSLDLKRSFIVNDYSMIGIQGGFGMATTMFNPTKTQGSLSVPYFGITYTKYGKLFGYLPYFGVQLGFFYGKDGYAFKPNKDGNYNVTVDGATKCTYDFIEVPAMAEFHYDSKYFKLMVDAGFYVGYRYKIHREGNYAYPDLMDDFTDYEYKWDYGLRGAAGFGIVLNPVEIHFKAHLRYGWGSLYEPDYIDKEYYRFAYPFDVMFTVGVHFQLGKRSGKTRSMLKKEARAIVYGE